MFGTQHMNDSYRATLIIVGLFLVASTAGWRLLQLEAQAGHERAGSVVSIETHISHTPAPLEPPASHAKPAARLRIAELVEAAQRGDVGAILGLVGEGVN